MIIKKIHNLFLLFLLGLFFFTSCEKDGEEIKTQYYIKVFGNEYQDEGIKILEAKDHGYYILANTQDAVDKDILLFKVDEYGNEQWRHQIVEDSVDNIAKDFYVNDQNELIVLSTTVDSVGSEQIQIIKVNETEGEVWNQQFGGPDSNEVGNSIIEVENSQSAVVGYYTDSDPVKRPYFLRIDAEGVEQKDRYLPQLLNTQYNSSIVYNETDIIVTGTIEENGNNSIRVVNIPINSGREGNPLGNVNQENLDNLGIQSYYEEELKEFYVLGNSTTLEGLKGTYLAKFEIIDEFDGEESILYKKNLENSADETFSSFIKLSDDQGFALVSTYGLEGSQDICLKTIDTAGNIQFEEYFGSFKNDIGKSLVQTNDGGFLILGTIGSGANSDICLIKTNPLGLVSK